MNMGRAVTLSTTRLNMYFGGLAAVKNLDVTVREGEIHGLIGPNGAGKTTFTNVVSGLIHPTSGTITFKGTDITLLDPYLISAMGLSRTFQKAQVFPKMTCLENVMVGHHPRFKAGILKTMFRPPFVRQPKRRSRRSGPSPFSISWVCPAPRSGWAPISSGWNASFSR